MRAVPRHPGDEPQPGRSAPPRITSFTRFTRRPSTRTHRSTTPCFSATCSSRRRDGVRSTLDAALHGNNIPTAVVGKPHRRDQGRHRAAAPLSPAAQAGAGGSTPIIRYDTTDSAGGFRPQVIHTRMCFEWLPASVAPLGPDYERELRRVSTASGSTCTRTRQAQRQRHSAPVYGVQPYMLLNYNDTL